MPTGTQKFSQVQILKFIPICPGCAQGKMKSRSFQESQSHATRLFELIHLDLKSLLVESYHQFKYFIVFIDNESSHMWTSNLRRKSDAAKAIKYFEAMAHIQHSRAASPPPRHPKSQDCHIHQKYDVTWMSGISYHKGQIMRGTPPDAQEMYGKTHPPLEIERDFACDWYWKKIVGPEAPSGSHVQPPQSRRNLLSSTQAPDSDTEENDQHDVTLPDDTEHPEISRQEAHKGGNMLIAKLLALAIPTSNSQHNVPTHYKDIVHLPVQQQQQWPRRIGSSSKKASL